ncbi:SAV_2336 N-terminal domain-related protein [Streptomyces tanashiensis]|uniref:SAV_2336 N-terminal domain-related protein n=1 Tax=Streptomyces tanashiensis TaxID=67367 RepID=UPI00342B703A
MADVFGPLVRALTSVLGEDADATAIADALWLAAAPTASRRAGGSVSEPSDVAGTDRQPVPAIPDTDEPSSPQPEEGADAPALYERLPDARPVPGTSVVVPGGRDLPRAMELRRALRPFKRRYPRGRRSELDLDATVRHFRRTGELAPVLSPGPEPWFELRLVIDTSPSMTVWKNTNAEFATLLSGLGVFRRVRTWGLRPGPDPMVSDHQGRRVAPGQAVSSDSRCLVLVLSDCVAPGWRQPETWRMLRRWGATGPVVLLNPLPSRLWHRTGLNLPAIRVKQRRPALKNTDLTFQVPLMLRTLSGAEDADWQALPTLTFSPHSLARWAETFMLGAPRGYDAVLVPRTGVLPSPFHAPQARHRVGPDPTEAFLRTASPMAVRLAVLCSPFSCLSLPLMHLIRQRLLPEAGVGELAELLTSPVVRLRTYEDGPPVAVFDPSSRERLAGRLSIRDAWLTHDALSRHIAAMGPGGAQDIQATAASDPESVPRELRPFARASKELLALLREGEPVRGLPLPGPSEAPVPSRAPAVPQHLPDPRRSAAVLIGVSDYGRGVSLHGVEADLAGMRSFLTSQGGWNLPGDRCITLANPREEREVLTAIRHACDMAETVLLYFSGMGMVDTSGQAMWLLAGEVDESERPRTLEFGRIARFVETAGPRHVMMILDHNGGTTASRTLNDWGRHGRTEQGDVGLQALFVDNAQDTPSGGPVTQELLKVSTEGAPDGPEFLDLAGIARYMASPAMDLRPITLCVDGPFPKPAFARNRAWRQHEDPAPADPAIKATYHRVRRNLLEAIPGVYKGLYQKEADRLLLGLLAFAAEFIDGTEQADSESTLADAVQAFLDRRGLSTEREVFPGDRRVDVVWRSKAARFAVEITDAEDPLDGVPSAPLSFQLLLRREPQAETSGLVDRVSTIVADSLDQGPCLVGIRLPNHQPYAPDPLSAAVESACAELLGESVATDDDEVGWTLNGVELPPGLTNLTIQGIIPDTESIVWDTVEEYEYGLILGQVTVDAELTLEGSMHKSDYYLAEPDVQLSEDLNDHMVEVSLYRSAQLVFDARRESEEAVELRFRGTNAPESHPHDPM